MTRDKGLLNDVCSEVVLVCSRWFLQGDRRYRETGSEGGRSRKVAVGAEGQETRRLFDDACPCSWRL